MSLSLGISIRSALGLGLQLGL